MTLASDVANHCADIHWPDRLIRGAVTCSRTTGLATLDMPSSWVGSGGLSHDLPVPTVATAPPATLERIVHGRPMSPEQRQTRQTAVAEAAHDSLRS
jgi:hypothetical protein